MPISADAKKALPAICIIMRHKYALMHEDDDFYRGLAFAKGEKDFA